MSTTPIRFLLVSESLRDRSLFHILRHEGHEVGWLVPEDSNLSTYPLPSNTPVMTTPAIAIDAFNPAVIVFPSPLAWELAEELIRAKKWVVGSSATHHQLALMDPRFAKSVLKTAGLKSSQSVYVEAESDFHYAMNMLDAYDSGSCMFALSYGPWNTFYRNSTEELRSICDFVGSPVGSRITVLPAGEGYHVRDLVAFFSGRQQLPSVLELTAHHSHVTERGKLPSGCTLKEVDFGLSNLAALAQAITAMRYVGPLFAQVIFQGDKVVEVVRITSVPPEGFWPALYGIQNFRDGFGNFFLHSGRQTLSSMPTHSYLAEGGPAFWSRSRRIFLPPWPYAGPFLGQGVSLPEDLFYSGRFVHEDVIDNTILGPQLGWHISTTEDPECYVNYRRIPTINGDQKDAENLHVWGLDTRPDTVDEPAPTRDLTVHDVENLEELISTGDYRLDFGTSAEYTVENPPPIISLEGLSNAIQRPSNGHPKRSDNRGNIPPGNDGVGLGLRQQAPAPDINLADGDSESDQQADPGEGDLAERSEREREHVRPEEESDLSVGHEQPAPDISD